MSLRSMIPFLIVVFLVALAGTYVAVNVLGVQSPGAADPRVQLVTVEVIVTATADPNATALVQVVTATPDRTQVALPDGLVPQGSLAQARPQSTLDPALVGANAAVEQSAAGPALPENCIIHTIAAGDSPFGVALEYGANPFLLMEANGLDDSAATQLQIGDALIVPLEGCPIETLPAFQARAAAADEASVASASAAGTGTATPSAEVTEEAEPDVTRTPSVTPTITLVPTAENAQVRIVGVVNAGDVTAEGLRIRNTGNTINVTGWTLTDLDGTTYTFGEQLIFSNTEVTIFTRAGQNTPIALFWGRDTAVWADTGDIATLRDAQGRVQASERIEGSINLP